MSVEPFPHAEYAEDQRFAHSILTTHVLHRAFATGAIGAIPYHFIRATLARSVDTSKNHFSLVHLTQRVAKGSLYTTAFVAVGLIARMYGKDTIEWQDRSWRLLANERQNRVDRWSIAGMVLGSCAILALGRRRGWVNVIGKTGSTANARATGIMNEPTTSNWRLFVGGAGLGSVGGTVGYMVESNVGPKSRLANEGST